MPAEAWVALVLGVTTIIGTIISAAGYIASKFTQAVTRFEVNDSTRASEISRINTVVEKIEITVSQIAVDRANSAALERRVATLERWYDELRRGVGRIEAIPSETR